MLMQYHHPPTHPAPPPFCNAGRNQYSSPFFKTLSKEKKLVTIPMEWQIWGGGGVDKGLNISHECGCGWGVPVEKEKETSADPFPGPLTLTESVP